MQLDIQSEINFILSYKIYYLYYFSYNQDYMTIKPTEEKQRMDKWKGS